MKKEHQAKARAAREKTTESYKKQVIPLTDKLTLKRADFYNWAIIRNGQEKQPWFYGKIIDALRELPHQMLQDGDKRTLQDILAQVDKIHIAIDRLYQFKGWEKLEAK